MVAHIYRAWDRLAAIEATAVSGDGYVSATVGARGDLRRLTVDPRIYRTRDAPALARAVLETVAAAVAIARTEAYTVVAPLLPRDADPGTADLAFDPLLHHLVPAPRRGSRG